MTTGTNGNDTIGTSVEFELISGLAGNDALTSTHNGAYLIGGLGDDILSSTVTLAAALGLQTQIGGAGEDDMSLGINNSGSGEADTQAVVVMDGGFGSDDILGFVNLTSSFSNTISAHFDGGFGADTIYSTVDTEASQTATSTNVTVGGNGNDTVTVAAAAAFSLINATSNLEVYLGNGTDNLQSSVNQGRSDGTLDLNTVIDGGAGTDTINIENQASSFGDGGAGTINVDIAGGNGQEIIDSLVVTDFGVGPGVGYLDNVTLTSTITGDNGADTILSRYNLTAINSVNSTSTIEGGTADDMITLDHDYQATSAAGVVIEALSIDLGTGDDTLNAELDVNDTSVASIVTNVTSSGGVNDVTLDSHALAAGFAVVYNTVTTGANDDTLDLTANAFIVSTGAAVANHVADARNTATTGGGDDVIVADAQAQSSGDATGGGGSGTGAFALNNFNTGALNDSITAGTYVYSDSNGGTGLAQFIADTSSGFDFINSTMSSDFAELFEVAFNSNINTGIGGDTITSNIDAFARDVIEVTSSIDGGGGNDIIISNIVAESSIAGTSMTISEVINGGAGNDIITTMFDGSQAGSTTGSNPSLSISGGDGNDTISATIIGLEGTLTIDGGIGNDTITVTCPVTNTGINSIIGGAGTDTITGSVDWDRISGDAGSDRIVASAGSDDYWGGSTSGGGDSEADTFVFNPSATNYFLRLQDFESDFDILEFAGLADTGPAGLVDDIDALGMFTDNGVGGSVIFDLTAGGSIIFNGAGTGAVSSIADLVIDANAQLIA